VGVSELLKAGITTSDVSNSHRFGQLGANVAQRDRAAQLLLSRYAARDLRLAAFALLHRTLIARTTGKTHRRSSVPSAVLGGGLAVLDDHRGQDGNQEKHTYSRHFSELEKGN